MAHLNLQHDRATARAFLEQLDFDGRFTFQAIPEGKAKTGKHPTVLHGSFAEVASRLADLNNSGHGIFVMVNAGDLKGRKAENVIRVRAHFVDLDGAPIQPVLDSEVPPHVVVETSPGRWHAYWRPDACPLNQFKPRQQALARRFNGDLSVCDLPRVMRLPGYWHLKKDTPFLTKLINPDLNGGAK